MMKSILLSGGLILTMSGDVVAAFSRKALPIVAGASGVFATAGSAMYYYKENQCREREYLVSERELELFRAAHLEKFEKIRAEAQLRVQESERIVNELRRKHNELQYQQQARLQDRTEELRRKQNELRYQQARLQDKTEELRHRQAALRREQELRLTGLRSRRVSDLL